MGNEYIDLKILELNLNVKTLYVVRHAKSSWANPDQADFDRPLNDRGKRDAPRMGRRLREKEIFPSLILSSPAKRAISTARKIASELQYNKDNIKTDRKLYHADEDTLLSIVQKLKNKHEVVMLVGHNPGLTDFVNSFMDNEVDIDNIPTCGVVAFQLPVAAWKEVTWGTAKMQFFDYPKSRDND